jgi:hypothetical protein
MKKNESSHQDLEAFVANIPWFIEPSSKVVLNSQVIQLSKEFKQTFPLLTKLIKSARVTAVTIDTISYTLFAWDNRDGFTSGWLNKIESEDEYGCELITEHQLLLASIGGIQESFDQPENSFSNNQNFMFLGSECFQGIPAWNEYYPRVCKAGGFEAIECSSFVTFVNEANGAQTMYDPASKKVYLFSHDHSFDNVEVLAGQPEYTFHRFKNVTTFVDYVEALAKQWIGYLKK